MINHVVLFKLNDYPAEKKKAVIAELKSLLEGLKHKIDELKHLEVGINYKADDKFFDIALTTHFNSIEDLDKYRVHPEHKKVVARIVETTSQRAAVDYEF